MLLCDQDADRDGSGSMDFQEFVEMMIKVGRMKWNFDSINTHLQRESEKETALELKQAFRVFDKVDIIIRHLDGCLFGGGSSHHAQALMLNTKWLN